MPSATTPPQLPSHPDVPPFPAPSTFSILPEIYLLLTRIDLLQQSQPQPQSTAASLPPTTPGGTALPPISTKDLPTLIHPIKQKIAKARATVQALPDMDRVVDAQQEEMRLLEAKVAALKERLAELGKIAGQGRNVTEDKDARDVPMDGVEV